MRFDVVTIFPEFFQVLDLSLIGKAQDRGLLEAQVHDLRDWTFDRHRSVDDTPYGGGAGMVMRADVWGRALDQIFGLSPQGDAVSIGSAVMENGTDTPNVNTADTEPVSRLEAGTAVADLEILPDQKEKVGYSTGRVLAIPTPSGEPLTQRRVEQLAASAKQIVFACGRYEGIDSRVAAHYRQRPEVEVFEFSLGDYVLNGGEVAALALIEAVSRLCGGVIGNPDSLTEESHSVAGLLEYPSYTKPAQWADQTVPEILLGGHHARIERWRRDRSLTVTAKRRPDLIAALPADSLERADRLVLAAQGYYWTGDNQLGRCRFLPVGTLPEVHSQVSELGIWAGAAALLGDVRRLSIYAEHSFDYWAEQVSETASSLFPLACPDYLTREQIGQFIAENLNQTEFSKILKDPYGLVILLQVQKPTVATSTASVTEKQRSGGSASTNAVQWQTIGYTYTQVFAPGGKPDDADIVDYCPDNSCYLSKCYLGEGYHGTGLSGALLEVTCASVQERYPWVRAAVLGTAKANRRARKFYKRSGFKTVGDRIFQVGETRCEDIVAVRDFTTKPVGHWAFTME